MTTNAPEGSENEIRREAARVLPRLSGGRLERRPRGYALVQRIGGRARLTVSEKMVAIFAARGWVEADRQGAYLLTSAGRTWMDARGSRRDAHGDIAVLDGGVRQDRASTPLDFLKRYEVGGQRFLTPEHCEAAERLERDFERARIRPRMTLDFSLARVDGQNGAQHSSADAIDAKRRCLEALDAAGPGLSDLLFETIFMARGLNEAERGFGWPARSAKTILRLALERLAHHYGLMSGGRRPGRIEAWRKEAAWAEASG